MCYHKLYIYTTCGHSSFSPHPLLLCQHASIAPSSTYSTSCALLAHPFQSLKLEHLCPSCQQRRDKLLEKLDNSQTVRFDEWRWKVSYSAPAAFAAEDPQQGGARRGKERERGNGKSAHKRWTWRRSRSRRSEGG